MQDIACVETRRRHPRLDDGGYGSNARRVLEDLVRVEGALQRIAVDAAVGCIGGAGRAAGPSAYLACAPLAERVDRENGGEPAQTFMVCRINLIEAQGESAQAGQRLVTRELEIEDRPGGLAAIPAVHGSGVNGHGKRSSHGRGKSEPPVESAAYKARKRDGLGAVARLVAPARPRSPGIHGGGEVDDRLGAGVRPLQTERRGLAFNGDFGVAQEPERADVAALVAGLARAGLLQCLGAPLHLNSDDTGSSGPVAQDIGDPGVTVG